MTGDEIGWVAAGEALERLVAVLKRTSVAAVDTEFVREKTYYPQLCLIQIATRDAVACIDCLAPLDLEPVLAELFRPDFTWVLHSARQDLEVIWQRTRRLPPRLIDTQIAAALCGYAPQIGLETLLVRTLGIELGESYARTDWSRRPLPAAPLQYALDDVRHLLAAWDRLEAQLAELGRTEWLDEDCARALAEPPEADALSVWARLKGVHGLPFAGAMRGARARALARDGCAARGSPAPVAARRRGAARNRGRRCRTTPRHSPGTWRRSSRPATAARCSPRSPHAADPTLQAEVRANAPQAVPDKGVIKALAGARARQRAAQLGIEPEILATRRDLVAVAAGRPPAHLTQGWRASRARVRCCSGHRPPADGCGRRLLEADSASSGARTPRRSARSQSTFFSRPRLR